MSPATAEAVVLDWTEKHRPRTLEDVVGNSKAVDALKDWARKWLRGEPPKVRAVILAGEPGVGKTTAAHALARDLGWGVIELNASDQRNADAIKRVAGAGALNRAFSFGEEGDDAGLKTGRQLIILDEADNMSGTTDRGGMRTIVDVIKETKQPIVLIANDLYNLQRKASSLRSLALTIKFSKVHTRSIPPALRRIAEAEGVTFEDGVMEAIADRAGGDLRSAVNDFQALATGREHVALDDVAALGARDATGDVWGLMGTIFYGKDALEARTKARDVDETPDHIALWVDENLPLMYADRADLVEGFNALSKADVYLGRVSRRQQYRLWAYASTLMTAGVNAAKSQRPMGARFSFPRWLSKMSASRGSRETRNTVARKIGEATHSSLGVSRGQMLPFLREMMAQDAEFAAWAAWHLHLTPEEVAWLLDTKPTTKKVKIIIERAAEMGPRRAKESAAAAAAAGLGAFRGVPDDAPPDAAKSGRDAASEAAPAPSEGGDGEETGEDAAAARGEDAEPTGREDDGEPDAGKAESGKAKNRSLFDF